MAKKSDIVIQHLMGIAKGLGEIGMFVGDSQVSKETAKRYGMSKKEADAILYGVCVGIGFFGINVMSAENPVESNSVEDVSLSLINDALSDYTKFRQAVKKDRVIEFLTSE